MSKFELFKKLILGNFNNLEQIEIEKSQGEITHMIAKNIRKVCNDKIKNLPQGFKGIFVIDESYYTDIKTDVTNRLPYLFLFEEVEDCKIKATAYGVSKSIPMDEFTNSNEKLEMDYNELRIIDKFVPMIYEYTEDKGFYAKSFSNFGNEVTLLLEIVLSENKLELKEMLKKGNRMIGGFETPIIYKRDI